MEPFVWIGVLAVIIALCCVFGFWLRQLFKPTKDARSHQSIALNWIQTIENQRIDEDVASAGRMFVHLNLHIDDEKREAAAIQKYKDAEHRIASRELGERAQRNSEPFSVAICYLFAYEQSLDSWLAFGIEPGDLGQYFASHVAATLTRVQAGDVAAMRGFKQLMAHEKSIATFCEHYGIEPPTYPDNWNELVTEHIGAPHVSDYHGIGKKNLGDIQVLCAEALEAGDVGKAKLVMAYCREGSRNAGFALHSAKKYKAAIGDVLYALVIVLANSRTPEARACVVKAYGLFGGATDTPH